MLTVKIDNVRYIPTSIYFEWSGYRCHAVTVGCRDKKLHFRCVTQQTLLHSNAELTVLMFQRFINAKTTARVIPVACANLVCSTRKKRINFLFGV